MRLADRADRPGSNRVRRDPQTETTHVEALETRSPDAGSIPAASTTSKNSNHSLGALPEGWFFHRDQGVEGHPDLVVGPLLAAV